MANKIKAPSVMLNLDKERLLILDFNAQAELHDATGKTMEEAFQWNKPEKDRKPPSLKFMRDLVWAGLLSGADPDDEDVLTRRQVGAMIQEYGADYVFGKLTEAFKAVAEDAQATKETGENSDPLQVAAAA